MRRVSLIVLPLVLAGLLNACTKESTQSTIVTSAYPLQFVVEAIAPEREVLNIAPVGVEPHDFELTPSSTRDMLNAKVVIVVGNEFQPAIEKIAAQRDHSTYVATEMLSQSSEGNPHFWLDPVLFKEVATGITNALINEFPEKKAIYEKRRDKLVSQLNDLDESFSLSFAHCEIQTFVTTHRAFTRLAQRYGLINASIAGISPENEPTPKRLREIVELIERENIDVVFTEENVSNKSAISVSNEARVSVRTLSPIEFLTERQTENNQNYFTLMESNRIRLVDALKCVDQT